MINHITALILGFVLDLFLGDPRGIPHPIILIGRLIGALERVLLPAGDPSASRKRMGGTLLVTFVCGITAAVTGLVMVCAYRIHPYAGIAAEAILTWLALAAKSLKTESMRVYERLEHGTIEEARYAVSMIVGRDTGSLTDEGVTKAAVETVAENTSDGVIAPMLYLAVGGPVLGYLYKAVNTMDSMVGYKNDRYMDFGRTAAKLDDVVNFIPARLSAYLMILSCMILGRDFSAGDARRIYFRDRFNHASPNSAQTESTLAGALGIRLAGPASYFGKVVDKPYIGDDTRPIEHEDIIRANRLMYTTSVLCLLLCIGALAVSRLLIG